MTEQTSPLILQKLTKSYGRERGIFDVSLEIHPGEIFGFLGPNGAGKSTTIRTILGFMQPTSGEIRLFGEAPSVAARREIGYLAGDVETYENMRGRAFLHYLAGLGQKIDWDYVDDLTKRLEAELDKPIRTLSKGNRQKIGIIQALMHRPKLLILDEPTSGLDPLIKQEFYAILHEISERDGTTIFVSSHDLAEVQKLCSRAAFIRDGKLASIENIEKIQRLSAKRFVVTLGKKPSQTVFAKIKSVASVEVNNLQLTCTVHGKISDFLSAVSLLDIHDFVEQSLDLEELFMHYYQHEEAK